MAENNHQKLVVLGTGGTIAGTAASAEDHTGYTAAQIGVEQLVAAIAGLDKLLVQHSLVVEQVAQLDSKDMDFATMARLAQRCMHWITRDDVAAIVITHGTDTLEETAYWLHLLLPKGKPVVLTCAMRPATSSEADGPRNMRDAMTVALDARATGVLCVCAGQVHRGDWVQKVHTHRLDAFSSGDAPALAQLHCLPSGVSLEWNEDQLANYLENMPEAAVDIAKAAIKNIANTTNWPRVEIVLNHTHSSGALVRSLLTEQGAARVQGIVAAGTGNGTLGQDLQTALVQAQAAGIRVWRASRCQGGVKDTAHDVLPSAGDLPYAKARIRMVLDLLAEELNLPVQPTPVP